MQWLCPSRYSWDGLKASEVSEIQETRKNTVSHPLLNLSPVRITGWLAPGSESAQLSWRMGGGRRREGEVTALLSRGGGGGPGHTCPAQRAQLRGARLLHSPAPPRSAPPLPHSPRGAHGRRVRLAAIARIIRVDGKCLEEARVIVVSAEFVRKGLWVLPGWDRLFTSSEARRELRDCLSLYFLLMVTSGHLSHLPISHPCDILSPRLLLCLSGERTCGFAPAGYLIRSSPTFGVPSSILLYPLVKGMGEQQGTIMLALFPSLDVHRQGHFISSLPLISWSEWVEKRLFWAHTWHSWIFNVSGFYFP